MCGSLCGTKGMLFAQRPAVPLEVVVPQNAVAFLAAEAMWVKSQLRIRLQVLAFYTSIAFRA